MVSLYALALCARCWFHPIHLFHFQCCRCCCFVCFCYVLLRKRFVLTLWHWQTHITVIVIYTVSASNTIRSYQNSSRIKSKKKWINKRVEKRKKNNSTRKKNARNVVNNRAEWWKCAMFLRWLNTSATRKLIQNQQRFSLKYNEQKMWWKNMTWWRSGSSHSTGSILGYAWRIWI